MYQFPIIYLRNSKNLLYLKTNSTISHLKEELKIELKRGSPTIITTDTSMYCISNLSMNCFTYSEHDNVNNCQNNEFSHPVTLVKSKRQCKKFIKRKIRAASIYVDDSQIYSNMAEKYRYVFRSSCTRTIQKH